MITPEEQKSRYSRAELITSADNYFDGIESNHIVLRKPYDHPHNASAISALVAVIQGSGIRPNDTVLDFGCGTCWLSKILAYYGCKVYAVDVSAKALAIGRKLISSDPYVPAGAVQFLAFDGETIPLAGLSVDRIVCSAAFHHVWSQEKILAEFCRVLKPGGVAAFHEPGPKHAGFPQSQMEMRDYKVIEDNIVIEDIEEIALRVGFERMQVALFFPTIELLSVQDFTRYVQHNLPGEVLRPILERNAQRFENLRVFVLQKPGAATVDSRSITDSLRAELNLRQESPATPAGAEISYSVSIKNTGQAVWLPSGSVIGSVNLGIHLFSGEHLSVRDYFRAPISARPVNPGEAVELQFSVPRPAVSEARLVFDLVAEGVVWFEMVGNKVVSVELPGPSAPA